MCALVFLIKEKTFWGYLCFSEKMRKWKARKSFIFPEKWRRAIHHSTCICFCPVPIIFWVWDRMSGSCSFVLSTPSQVGQLIHTGEQALQAAGHLALPKGTQFSSSRPLQLPPRSCPKYTTESGSSPTGQRSPRGFLEFLAYEIQDTPLNLNWVCSLYPFSMSTRLTKTTHVL